MKKTIRYYVLTTLLLDVLMVDAALLLAYALRFNSGAFEVQQVHPLSSYLAILILQAVAFPLAAATQGLYRVRRSVSWTDEFYAVFVSVSISLALVAAVTAFTAQEFEPSRLVLAVAWVMSMLSVTFGRYLHHLVSSALRAHGVGSDRALVVGSGDIAASIVERMLANPSLGYQPVGIVSDEEGVDSIRGVTVLGKSDALSEVIRERQVDEVFVAVPGLSHSTLLDIADRCRLAKVGIKVYPDLFQIMASEISISDLGGLPIVTVRDLALTGWNLVLKRLLDVTVSAAALVVLSPFMLAVALLIKLTSPQGGVFYCQERVGLDGRPFQTLKFRSMIPDAEADTGPVWAQAGDDRTTLVGKWLRRLSVDELPQLVNVLVGEMSLVGPRPERPHFVEQFRKQIPRYWERHSEKAGLTGWAQVNGLRGNTSVEERTAYDLWYVENWTVWLDVKIMLRTILGGFRGKNAY